MKNQENRPSSQNPQLLDTASYLNERIQEGAEVNILTSHLSKDWPVTKVGIDFVVFRTDNGKEWVAPRYASTEFIVTPKAPAR